MAEALYSFLECGIPENDMARVLCEECGHDFFVAYSCRCRVACPSCSTKRSILFGEKVREIVKPVSHLHITFTIPRILWAYFRRNRKLLRFLVQSANWTIEKYFQLSPHLHALVPAGIMKDGLLYEQRNTSTPVIADIFRARLLTVLLGQGVITQELINMLMSWNHHSVFNVHVMGIGDAVDLAACRRVDETGESASRVIGKGGGHSIFSFCLVEKKLDIRLRLTFLPLSKCNFI